MATIAQDVWTELAYVAITAQAATDVRYQAVTETIDIDAGEKDITALNMVSGARIVKFTPETETTITLEAYPLYAGTKVLDNTTGKGFWHLLHAADNSEPIQITNTLVRNKYRIAILWCDDSTATNAATTITSGAKALRFVAADGHFTSVKPSFTDGVLKFTITYKVPAFDASGNSNIKMESISGSAELAALASYTSVAKW